MDRENIVSHQLSRVRHGEGEARQMQAPSALKEFFLEREKQRQDENSPSCFLQEICCSRSRPSQICQEGSFEITTDEDTGSEVPRITSYLNQRSAGREGGLPSDVILNPGPHSDPLESLTTSGSEGGSCLAA